MHDRVRVYQKVSCTHFTGRIFMMYSNRMQKVFFLICCTLCSTYVIAQQGSIPIPSKAQLAWHEMEYYWFMHFGPNTFTGKEWGHGDEKEEVFDPEQLDCRQWCRIAKAAGAKGIIITAKHHDGFCLWPSKYSNHTVRESKWKNGKGDVLRELSQACKVYGLKFGVYISPWDRNHPKYGTEAYNDVFVHMMEEIFSNYGPIWELWWVGANGEGPNGKKQQYDWPRFEALIKKISPQTVIFSDIGPGCRWVGNENGIAGTTNWNYLNTAGFTRGAGSPPTDTLNRGNVHGKKWIPAECDVSIRPGWFYHQEEDSRVKSPAELFDLYLKSVGRGANLLLNVPPDGRGLVSNADSAAAIGFKHLRTENFRKPIFEIQPISSQNPIPRASWKVARSINCVVLKEDLRNGQFVDSFSVLIKKKNIVVKAIGGTTIGRKRILTFPDVEADAVEVRISGERRPKLTGLSVYRIDPMLIEK